MGREGTTKDAKYTKGRVISEARSLAEVRSPQRRGRRWFVHESSRISTNRCCMGWRRLGPFDASTGLQRTYLCVCESGTPDPHAPKPTHLGCGASKTPGGKPRGQPRASLWSAVWPSARTLRCSGLHPFTNHSCRFVLATAKRSEDGWIRGQVLLPPLSCTSRAS